MLKQQDHQQNPQAPVLQMDRQRQHPQQQKQQQEEHQQQHQEKPKMRSGIDMYLSNQSHYSPNGPTTSTNKDTQPFIPTSPAAAAPLNLNAPKSMIDTSHTKSDLPRTSGTQHHMPDSQQQAQPAAMSHQQMQPQQQPKPQTKTHPHPLVTPQLQPQVEQQLLPKTLEQHRPQSGQSQPHSNPNPNPNPNPDPNPEPQSKVSQPEPQLPGPTGNFDEELSDWAHGPLKIKNQNPWENLGKPSKKKEKPKKQPAQLLSTNGDTTPNEPVATEPLADDSGPPIPGSFETSTPTPAPVALGPKV